MIWIVLGPLLAVLLICVVYWPTICYHFTRRKYKKGKIKGQIKGIVSEVCNLGPGPRPPLYFERYLSEVDGLFSDFFYDLPRILASREYISKKRGKAKRRVREALERDYRKNMKY